MTSGYQAWSNFNRYTWSKFSRYGHETWIDEAKRGMKNALRANPLDIREQYEKPIK